MKKPSITVFASMLAMVLIAATGTSHAQDFSDDHFINGADRPAGLKSLEGKPAPELVLDAWIGDETSLEKLRGKVVVVDFWATWCGPCVASFPDVAELVKYFDGYDVVFLGVTSPQKRVFFRDERGRQDAEDFAAECKMMADYKKSMGMTWPIVMTKQNVFNPDFAIEGIPHVAIIGADGKVAYNGMHPAGDPAEKVEKINGLLEKAGKKTPGPWKPKAEKPNADQG